MTSFFISLFSFDRLNSSANFTVLLIVQFEFGLLLSWLLTIFTKCSSSRKVLFASLVGALTLFYLSAASNRRRKASVMFLCLCTSYRVQLLHLFCEEDQANAIRDLGMYFCIFCFYQLLFCMQAHTSSSNNSWSSQ